MRVRAAGLSAAVVLLFVLVIHLPSFGQPLTERHSFRQTQTAYTARVFHEEGIDLLHSKLPILGPPWEVPFEFPVFQAAAATLMNLGVPEDPALRVTGFASFLAAAGLLWLLARQAIGPIAAAFAVTAFALSPLALLWSRTAMIEYLAVALALAFAVAGLRWRAKGHWAWFLTALAFGSLAMVVKLPTALLWVVPFALLGYSTDPPRPRRTARWPRLDRRHASAAALSIVPLVVGLGWTAWTDSIKTGSAWTLSLTSRELGSWMLGPLTQRLDPALWLSVVVELLALVGGLIVLPVAVVVVARLAVGHRQRRFWLWVVGALIGPTLVFFNLYTQHDYYVVAESAAAALVLGGAASWAIDRWHVRPVRTRALLMAGTWLAASVILVGYWGRAYQPADPDGVLPAAAQIAATTTVDDRVAIIGWSWSPALLYYAHRWGLAVPDWDVTDALSGELASQGYVVFRCTPPGVPAPDCVKLAGPGATTGVSSAQP